MTLTTAHMDGRAHDEGVTDDPAPRPKRRSFTAEYKARVLAEYEALPAFSPERGALLRREGLYASHIAEWRNVARAAALSALTPAVRTPSRTAADRELERAKARIAGLEAELARTRLALEITGKAHALLELLSESAATEPRSRP
jgi:transposase